MILLLLALLTPLSLSLYFLGDRLGLSYPTELILIALTAWFVWQCLQDKKRWREALHHPFSLWIALYLGWIFLSAFVSPLPIVALKAAIVKTWFILPCYYYAMPYFRMPDHRERFMQAFLLSMALVVLYATVNLLLKGYSYNNAFDAMAPFVKDHTNYGALTSLILPFSVYFVIFPRGGKRGRLMAVILTLVIALGLVLSLSRAAWLSVIAAAGIGLLIYWRIRIRWVLLAGGVVLTAALVFHRPLLDKLNAGQYRGQSDNLKELFLSSFNMQNNLSNLERVNRWKCALQMAEDRPLFGYGPGTYTFVYGPYQNYYDKTSASSNRTDFAYVDNAYLNPLAELGVPGFLIFLVIGVYLFRMSYRIYHRSPHKSDRYWVVAIALSLVTFYVHGFFNNYFELDKAAVPLFAMFAMLTVMDEEAKERA